MNQDYIKLEKTCACIASLEHTNDNDESKLCEFIERHEYQVDVYIYLERSHYKVYQNGGWNDFVILDEKEFKENFKLIE